MTPDHATRDDRLKRLDRMIEAWQERFAAAISEDFGNRPAVVTTLTDVVPVRAAIRHARRHLKRWMRPRRVSLAWTGKPASAVILRQPLGVVGIVAPWNYPLNLMLSPLTGALAAGNRAILKPSELTPAFSDVLAKAVAETFAEDEVAVVTGGPEVATAFTSAPFDHLIFTGSTAVGRKVAEAAAKNLTPVTLELGGKSPAILDASVQFDKAVPRLVWGKLLNSGQTCVAPDYALVPRERVADFLAAVKAEVNRQYPGLPANADYTTIISPRHFSRLTRLVEEAREKGAEVVELAGPHDGERRVFSPVAVIGAPDETAVMSEEIFGPILRSLPMTRWTRRLPISTIATGLSALLVRRRQGGAGAGLDRHDRRRRDRQRYDPASRPGRSAVRWGRGVRLRRLSRRSGLCCAQQGKASSQAIGDFGGEIPLSALRADGAVDAETAWPVRLRQVRRRSTGRKTGRLDRRGDWGVYGLHQVGLELGKRHRAAEEPTLEQVAADVLEKGELGRGFHALGDGH